MGSKRTTLQNKMRRTRHSQSQFQAPAYVCETKLRGHSLRVAGE